MLTPAEQLEGLTLPNDWTVGTLIQRTGSQTGGHFSTSYPVARSDGTRAFLKAMDYTRALKASDPAKALNILTSAFLFEREALQECIDRKMSRIVRAIDGGKTNVAGTVVEYLIFEEARGDIRNHLDTSKSFDLIWTLTCVHNVCVGVQQLHNASIAHQDLKPSNVLHFGSESQKLADLGRAWRQTHPSPHDMFPCAGDRTYAPPELLYGYSDPNELDRRFGADFYLVGSLALFLFTGMRASSMLVQDLALPHHPRNWRGTYHEVLPYLQHAFALNILKVEASFSHPMLKNEVVDTFKQMCDPNIAYRGDKFHRSKHGSRFGLQRFISQFDRLRTAAIVGRIGHR